MTYFVMLPRDPEEGEDFSLSVPPAVARMPWLGGERFPAPPPVPLTVGLSGKPAWVGDLVEVPLPLMSRRLARVLTAAGVTHVDFYPVTLQGEGGPTKDAFVAFHVIGQMDRKNFPPSRFSGKSPRPSPLERLTPEERKARNALFFRPAVASTCLVVHDSLRRTIESAGLRSVVFVPPQDRAA